MVPPGPDNGRRTTLTATTHGDGPWRGDIAFEERRWEVSEVRWDFKQGAVRLVLDPDRPIAQVVHELSTARR